MLTVPHASAETGLGSIAKLCRFPLFWPEGRQFPCLTAFGGPLFCFFRLGFLWFLRPKKLLFRLTHHSNVVHLHAGASCHTRALLALIQRGNTHTKKVVFLVPDFDNQHLSAPSVNEAISLDFFVFLLLPKLMERPERQIFPNIFFDFSFSKFSNFYLFFPLFT